ncbi:MAG: 3-dehydroquinate synthase [Gemmatimonadales bacterium]|nr:MAG: 3-dehydroquinate synthase [Gemmatimonadales bacterium]
MRAPHGARSEPTETGHLAEATPAGWGEGGGAVTPSRTLVQSAIGGEYPVVVGPSALTQLPDLLRDRAPAHAYALVADDRVMELHGDTVAEAVGRLGRPVHRLSFPHGEENKNRGEWIRLTDALLERGVGRDGCVVALGGGVTGDLAGFVAASYMRGIPVVQLPTSIVAMVDSSVGGKTGVDVPLGKNLVGAFHPPRFVLADTELAGTLPRAERSQGLAEAVKHGAIVDAPYLERIVAEADALLAGADPATTRMVSRSVEIKADVVSRDETEGGLRQILNFGHTLGHALEAASGYRLPHGSAVAVGMILEARLGERLGVTEPGTAVRLQEAVAAVELPTEPPAGLSRARVMELLARDKKARAGSVRFVLLERLGRVFSGKGDGPPTWSRSVPEDALVSVLDGV